MKEIASQNHIMDVDLGGALNQAGSSSSSSSSSSSYSSAQAAKGGEKDAVILMAQNQKKEKQKFAKDKAKSTPKTARVSIDGIERVSLFPVITKKVTPLKPLLSNVPAHFAKRT